MTDFQIFIASIGEGTLAQRLAVSRRCVASWRQGTRKPRMPKAQAMVEMSNGRLTLATIYAPQDGPSDA